MPPRIVASVLAGLGDDSLAGVNADAQRQLDPFSIGQFGEFGLNGLLYRQRSEHGTFRIILVSSGRAKEREQAIVQAVIDAAAIARDFRFQDRQQTMHHLGPGLNVDRFPSPGSPP